AVLILRGQSRALTDTATFSPAAAIIGDVAGVRSGDAPDVVRERLVELAGRVSDARASARTAQRLALLLGPAEGRDETGFGPATSRCSWRATPAVVTSARSKRSRSRSVLAATPTSSSRRPAC